MGVDWISCNMCGENFPDCGDYVICEKCGTNWCSHECASEDGYTEEYCRLGFEIEDGCCDDGQCEDDECEGCEHYVPESCSYCRCENYEDYELLNKAMEILGCDRQFLIDKINEKL